MPLDRINTAIDKALEHIGLVDHVKRSKGALIRADENGQKKPKLETMAGVFILHRPASPTSQLSP